MTIMPALTTHSDLPPEQEEIRAKCYHPTGTFVEFEKEEVEQSITARFEKQVALYPDQIAVKTRRHSLTYAELNRAADRVAHAILEKRGQASEPVALLFDHGLDAIIGYLGTLKAGKILIVVDPSLPAERIVSMLENSQAAAIVTGHKNLSFAKALTKTEHQVINVDACDSALPQKTLGLQTSPADVSQIVYSSGTTGQPKGVFFDHRRVLHDVMVQVNLCRICPDDRIIEFRKLSFGAGFKGLLRALLTGAAFFPYDVQRAGLAPLADFLNKEGITIFSPGISIFRHFINNLSGAEKFSSIRIITLGGAAIFHGDVEAYKKIFPESCLLVHGLSSSEAGLLSYYFINKKTDLGNTFVPVGYPVEDKKILLLDENGKEVDPGQVGEIAVQSRYLSSGYWRNTELTNARFLADPTGGDERIHLTGDLGQTTPDGSLIHLGRKDLMVKIRGYRVEIGEIERTLLSHPQVVNAGLAVWDRESGEKYLAAYVVPRQVPAPNISSLTEFLREKLPDYMIPSAFMFLEALPLTNGKLDRKALPKPADKRPEMTVPYAPPRTEIERKLSQIWAGVLSLDKVGIHDNFFDLGGHSLAATRVVSQVIKQFQIEVPLQTLFQAPTVAQMAAVITEHQGKQLASEELDRILKDLESLSEEEAQRLISDRSGTANTTD